MAGGKRFKFQGSKFLFVTDWLDDSQALSITGITQANPAVVSSAGHGLAAGTIVRIEDVVGMTELNGAAFVVTNPTTDAFELADVDSSGYAAYVSGGEIQPAVMSNLCELTDYNRSGGSSPEIPATSACSTAAEFEIGLPDFGTTQVTYNFAPLVVAQAALEGFYRSGEMIGVRVELPKNGGKMVQLGFVQQTGEQAGTEGLWIGNLTIRNTGPRVDLA